MDRGRRVQGPRGRCRFPDLEPEVAWVGGKKGRGEEGLNEAFQKGYVRCGVKCRGWRFVDDRWEQGRGGRNKNDSAGRIRICNW